MNWVELSKRISFFLLLFFRTTHSTSLSPSMTYRRGWEVPPSSCMTALTQGSLSSHSNSLHCKGSRSWRCVIFYKHKHTHTHMHNVMVKCCSDVLLISEKIIKHENTKTLNPEIYSKWYISEHLMSWCVLDVLVVNLKGIVCTSLLWTTKGDILQSVQAEFFY